MIWRVVTAKRHTASLTDAEMDPARADFYALFTFPALFVFDVRDGFDVRTGSIIHDWIILFAEELMNIGNRNRSFADG
jgi:hypothetical protein